MQEENMVLKPWVLIATVLMQNLDGMELSQLVEQTVWLRDLARSFGAFLDWPGEEVVIHTYGLTVWLCSLPPDERMLANQTPQKNCIFGAAFGSFVLRVIHRV